MTSRDRTRRPSTASVKRFGPCWGNRDETENGLRLSPYRDGMFFLLWQLGAWLIHRPILPPPLEVLPIFTQLMIGPLGLHFAASAGRVLAAIALAVVTAVPAGLALGQIPLLNRIFAPLIAILYPIPKIVLLPVIYVLMGITDVSKIF